MNIFVRILVFDVVYGVGKQLIQFSNIVVDLAGIKQNDIMQ